MNGTPSSLPWPPCPICGDNLAEAEVMLGQGVPAHHDPEGKARIELNLDCPNCETAFFVFVAVDDLQETEA